MPNGLRWGSAVTGAAMVGFGAMNLVRLDGVPGIQPWPPWLPAHALFSVVSGLVLIAAGVALLLWRMPTRGAQLLAATLTVWLVVLHGPPMIAAPTNPGAWVPACEVLSLCAAAWVSSARLTDRDPTIARAVFGATFLIFGLSHALYLGYVESVIPKWIPAPHVWAIATGLAHAAAGVSLLTRVQDRLAATMLAIMFGTWFVILHIPRVVANPAPAEWSSMFVALAMCGASWSVAATLQRADARVRERVAEPGLAR